MKFNVSRTRQVFYSGFGEPVEVLPRFCVDEGMINAPSAHCLSEGLALLSQLKRKPDSTIVFWRTFALGDLLLLTPIFNWLKDEYPSCQIYLATADSFLGLFRYWDRIKTVDKRYLFGLDYDVGYQLDGVVEKDHQGDGNSYKHRTDLYADFIGIPVPKDPLFSLPYGEEERIWAEQAISNLKSEGKPIIAMQVFGSTDIKRFSIEKVSRICKALAKDYSLILVHNHQQETDLPEVLNLTGKTSVHQLAALIDVVDAVVTMDSGILWIAHCTSTPLIALLGPTREEERLIYHKNYQLVNLSKMVGCEPCFERRTRCNGKLRCMTESDENLISKEIKDGIAKLLS